MRSVIAFVALIAAALIATSPALAGQDNYVDFQRGKALTQHRFERGQGQFVDPKRTLERNVPAAPDPSTARPPIGSVPA